MSTHIVTIPFFEMVWLLCAFSWPMVLFFLFFFQAELEALDHQRSYSHSRSFHGATPVLAMSDPIDVQLHKSVAKATIKLGARVTTLEAKVCGMWRSLRFFFFFLLVPMTHRHSFSTQYSQVDQILVQMDEMMRALAILQGKRQRTETSSVLYLRLTLSVFLCFCL